MSKELDELTLAIEQVLGEVPSDLAVRRLCLQVLVEGRSVVTLDVYFAHEWLGELIIGLHPLLDLSLRPRLLRAKLVAREGQNPQAVALVRIVHLLVLAIVPIGQASLRGHIDDDDGLCTLDKVAHGLLRLARNLADKNIHKLRCHICVYLFHFNLKLIII